MDKGDFNSWEEAVKFYKEEYKDLPLEEFMDRMMMKWEDGEFEDVQAFSREVEKGIKEYRNQKANQPNLDTQYKNLFRNDGATWTINFNDINKTIKHTKGMDYIALLLRHQGQRLHSMEMYQIISEIVPDVNERMSKTSPEMIDSNEGFQVKNDS